MLTKEIQCDVTFKVGRRGSVPESLVAHKYMLACRSQVFADMFDEEDESTNLVQDMDATVFRQILR